MAQDSFLGAFQGLPPWQLAHAAAGAPFDALQVQMPLMGGWDHDVVAMGSLVSPPSPSTTFGGAHEQAALMEQLASRLGISVLPSSSQYASCYSTPVGSPSSKPVAVAAPTNAMRVSCFAASGGKLSRVASSQSLLGGEQLLAPSPGGGVAPHTSDGSSSDGGPSRKRKAPPAGGKSGKAKEAKSPDAERRAKKGKVSADVVDEPKPEAGQRSSGSKGKEVAVAEPPKDYIHVRARRGQATDSHSLAERVRREKISERMKLLQDIVPGCSKVTGKAVMLDEIINYVQSLQRHVEFLSMKLSTVNPRLDVDVGSFAQKDGNNQSPATSLPPPPVYSMEASNSAFCYSSPPAAPAATSANKGLIETTPSSTTVNHHNIQLEGFQNANNPQIGSLWEEADDLQSLVQMGFRGCNTHE